jgi:hypothetical protein
MYVGCWATYCCKPHLIIIVPPGFFLTKINNYFHPKMQKQVFSRSECDANNESRFVRCQAKQRAACTLEERYPHFYPDMSARSASASGGKG